MKLKYVTTLVLCSVLFSCASQYFEINSSYKRIKHPGVASAKSFVEYAVEFNSNHEFKIDKVSLQNNKSYGFLLFSLAEKNYVKSTEKHTKGKYILTFKTNNTKTINNEDVVLLSLNVNNKITQQKITVVKRKAFRGR